MISIPTKKIMMTHVNKSTRRHLMPVTVLCTDKIKVLQIKTNKDESINIYIGLFAMEKSKQDSYNKAFLNANYQEKDVKRQIIECFNVKKADFAKKATILNIFKEAYANNKLLALSDVLTIGSKVNVYGTSKGKGFAGVMKRHGFSGLCASHGVSLHHRAPGSIGSRNPNNVIRGKKMPGRMGGKRVCVRNLAVLQFNEEKNFVVLEGSVPGFNGARVNIKLI